jgi:hypothetical protein
MFRQRAVADAGRLTVDHRQRERFIRRESGSLFDTLRRPHAASKPP